MPFNLAVNNRACCGEGEGEAVGLGLPVGDGEPVGLGLPVGVTDAVGEGEAVGLGLPVGVTLAVGDGEAVGLALPVGLGVAVTQLNVPERITAPPFLTVIVVPLVICGTESKNT